MEKNIIIISEGHEGDFHLMSLNEMLDEVRNIAENDEDYLELDEAMEDEVNDGLMMFVHMKVYSAKYDIDNGCIHKYHDVTYQRLTDSYIKGKWKELEDVLFTEDKYHNLVLSDDWFIFDKGEYKENIWHWFDKHYSKGIECLLMKTKE